MVLRKMKEAINGFTVEYKDAFYSIEKNEKLETFGSIESIKSDIILIVMRRQIIHQLI